MVLIFAPVTIEVINTRKIGIKFIEMRNKIFLFLNLNLNFIFFKITEIIKKNGSKIIICFIKKIAGFFTWLIKAESFKADLVKP